MVMCIFYKFLLMSQNFQSLHQTERRQENQCGSLTKCIMIIGPQPNQLVDKMTRWQWLSVGFAPPLKEGIS